MNPVKHSLRFWNAALEESTEEVRKLASVPSRAESMADVEVGQTPSEVVYSENKLELLRYGSLTEEQNDVPVLIVYALINRPFIMDLQPDRSIVRRLLEAGNDVYLIDWDEPSALDASLTLDDYVNRYIDNCVDVVRERSGQDSVNVLGYCMGGTMSAIYAAVHPEKVNALGLMAAGLHFDDTGGVLETWGSDDFYDPRDLTGAFGNVPGEFLDAGFALMDPVANYVTKYVHLYDRIENEDFVENFARMERWISESVDVAGGVYAEFIEKIYQDNQLYENRLEIDGERVDIGEVDMPVLQIVGEYDHLVPTEASVPFNDVIGSDEVTTIEYPTGHVGLAMSTTSHREVWPEVAEWFVEKSGRQALADVIGEGVEEALGVDIETDVTVGDFDEVEIGIADEDGEIARALIRHDARAIETFLEDTLGIEIGLETGEEGIAVEVRTDDGVRTTIVKNVGEATRTEVEEAVRDVNIAASYDLEDIEGIGPTYAGRLRAAGIVSASELAVADVEGVSDAAEASETLARGWIEKARELVGAK